MRIDRAGWPFITGPLAPAAVLAGAGRATGRRWAGRAAWPFLALSAYMALFFRDPDRRCDAAPPDADEVLSPADGVVMVAGEPQEGVAPDGDWQQVSVFLSVVDVHVNRSPYRGEVVESSYRQGQLPGRLPQGVRAPQRAQRAVAARRRPHRRLPADRRRPGPPDRHPHRPAASGWPPASGWA